MHSASRTLSTHASPSPNKVPATCFGSEIVALALRPSWPTSSGMKLLSLLSKEEGRARSIEGPSRSRALLAKLEVMAALCGYQSGEADDTGGYRGGTGGPGCGAARSLFSRAGALMADQPVPTPSCPPISLHRFPRAQCRSPRDMIDSLLPSHQDAPDHERLEQRQTV